MNMCTNSYIIQCKNNPSFLGLKNRGKAFSWWHKTRLCLFRCKSRISHQFAQGFPNICTTDLIIVHSHGLSFCFHALDALNLHDLVCVDWHIAWQQVNFRQHHATTLGRFPPASQCSGAIDDKWTRSDVKLPKPFIHRKLHIHTLSLMHLRLWLRHPCVHLSMWFLHNYQLTD